MRELYELVSLQVDAKSIPPNWHHHLLEAGSKSEQLLQLIIQTPGQTDEAAMQAIYGNIKDASAKFSSLKARLKSKLIQALFTLEWGDLDTTDRDTAYLECNKRWAAANILLSRQKKLAAFELLEQLLKFTRHFEFTELSVSILGQLRHLCSLRPGDARKYAEYRLLYRHYQTILQVENEAEDLYNDLMMAPADTMASRKKIAAQAEKDYQRVAEYLLEDGSFRLHLSARLLEMSIHVNQGDHAAVEQLCLDSIAFFQQKPYNCSLPLQIFYYQLITCCIQQKQYEKGRAIIETHQSMFSEGSYNWFKLQESMFLLAMHSRRYAEAAEVHRKVAGHNKLSAQSSWVQETWKLYEAYVQFLARVGQPVSVSPQFKVARFLNEVPEFNQDKRCMNVPVLIAQMLFMITGDHQDKAVDRAESLEKYAGRYLREDDLLRSRCFLRMLCEVPKAGFKRVAVERKTVKFLDRLLNTPLEISNQPHEIEIIPYNDLWEMILPLL